MRSHFFHHAGVIALVAAIAVVPACGRSESPPPATPPAAAPSTPPPGAVPAGRDPQTVAPQWPAASSANRGMLGAMPPQAAAAIDQSPVPVLVPTDPGVLRGSTVTTSDQHYTFASSAGGVTLSVQAGVSVSGATPATAGAVPALPRTAAGARQVYLTQNEGIRVATWMENGIAYSADVECATRTDKRCQDDTYLLSVVQNLTFVGGRPR